MIYHVCHWWKIWAGSKLWASLTQPCRSCIPIMYVNTTQWEFQKVILAIASACKVFSSFKGPTTIKNVNTKPSTTRSPFTTRTVCINKNLTYFVQSDSEKVLVEITPQKTVQLPVGMYYYQIESCVVSVQVVKKGVLYSLLNLNSVCWQMWAVKP